MSAGLAPHALDRTERSCGQEPRARRGADHGQCAAQQQGVTNPVDGGLGGFEGRGDDDRPAIAGTHRPGEHPVRFPFGPD